MSDNKQQSIHAPVIERRRELSLSDGDAIEVLIVDGKGGAKKVDVTARFHSDRVSKLIIRRVSATDVDC